jgi:hypothetical protein
VLGVGAVASAAIAPGVSGHPLAAVEDLDGARSDADIDFLE